MPLPRGWVPRALAITSTLVAFLAAGCVRDRIGQGVPASASGSHTASPDSRPVAVEASDEDATLHPAGLNQIAALAVDGEHVWLATSGGIVVLNPRSRSVIVLPGDAQISNANATDIAIAPDGVAWTSHGLSAKARGGLTEASEAKPTTSLPREGGIRAFGRGATVTAYFAEDGLGSDEIDSIAAGRDFVAAAAGPALAILSKASNTGKFETRLTESPRRLQVIDLAGNAAPRRVVEFRPRAERMTSVAIDGSAVLVGSTDAIYRIDGDDTWRFGVACRVRGGVPSQVIALAPLPGGFVASLALPGRPGEAASPAGLAEVRDFGRLARCHAPGIDVPAAITPDVAVDGRLIWLATYEGIVRIEGDDPELLARGVDVPAPVPTAIAGDGKGGVWVGTWGGGAWHLSGGLIETFLIGPANAVSVETSRLGGS